MEYKAFFKKPQFKTAILPAFIVGFLLGLPIDGSFILRDLKAVQANAMPKEWREGEAGLVNPLLGVNYPDKTIFADMQPLQQQLNLIVQNNINSGKAARISVYLKDQVSGHWTGVNENDAYAPASLIKIPMMITYYKVAETNPEILNQMLQYLGPDQNSYQVFKPSHPMVVGQYYSVNDLINRMIMYSDNNAILMLFNNMDKKTLNEIFADLSIAVPSDVNKEGDYISPGSFSRFFRILYNATYLSESYSEKALDLLAKSDFKDGLVAGVPANVTVAHKFGETPDVDSNGNQVGYELHDCGIVYYPNAPYVLCVMTQGNSYVDLANVIKEISAATYAGVKKLAN